MWPKNLQIETPVNSIVQTYQTIDVIVPILVLPPSLVKFNQHTRVIKINKND